MPQVQRKIKSNPY